jgi:hypothetical protein
MVERVLPTTKPVSISKSDSIREKGINAEREGKTPDTSDSVSNGGKIETGPGVGIAAILVLAALVWLVTRGKKKG